MPKVAYTKDNVEKCWCGKCPVQAASTCANELYEEFDKTQKLPSPERLGGLYCSTGKTICTDVNFVNRCHCSTCLVWAENSLMSNHYCMLGSAGEIGR